ncbi:NUDIX hydrolase [Labrys monachus]|uniref:8-oxo-dGTP pyrophosphatase MutT (NUDIX family) n=1 Tax=Labrys monachus TaxID=217067 RepID=A0ABU0FA83_9HYPH|nr:NUDIX domain-containing protein [Labrys monachus]MDQ0391523.1 8-oxo-dGTP pyrophosphatase MutT (NUDIX family) [Labrys monachus]
MTDDAISIVAAVILDESRHVLLVRKRGTRAFIQPGGKIEPSEAPLEALRREIAEELGSGCEFQAAIFLGRYRAPAANEAGRWVDALLYEVALHGPVAIAAEIEELAWVDAGGPGPIELAPLTRDIVLPLVASGRT